MQSASVLIIDANEQVRESLGRAFALERYQVRFAAGVQAAAADLASQPADLVLLDMDSAGEGGRTLAAQMAARWPSRPVIGMTTNLERAGMLAAGLALVLEKPLELPALFAQARRLLAEVSPVCQPGAS